MKDGSGTSSRIFGLDVMRAAAILIVMIDHSRGMIASVLPGFPWLPLPDGVDVFFVLSGFLVGGILLKTIRESGTFSVKMLWTFLQRRWFRTLPNYFLFLLLNITLIYFGFISGDLNKFLLLFFVFLQNFCYPFAYLFTESWSLSVEEWFYFSFPLLLLAGYILFRKQQQLVFGAVILIYLLGPLIYRTCTSSLIIEDGQYDLFFRKLVLTRLDSIGYGVAGAFINSYFPILWKRIAYYAFGIGLLLLAWLCRIHTDPVTHFLQTIYFSLMSFAIALLLPLLSGMKTESIPGRPFRFVSRISYALYLCNMLIVQLFVKYLHPQGRVGDMLNFLLCWVTVFIAALLVYALVEAPFLRMRDKVVSI